MLRWFFTLLLSELLIALPLLAVPPPREDLSPVVYDALQKALEMRYTELFEEAPGLEFNEAQIVLMRRRLQEAEKTCRKRFEELAKSYRSQLRRAQDELSRRRGQLTEPERHELHCRIQSSRAMQSQAEMLARHAVPVAYENKQAKLDLIGKWPAELLQIKADIASGAYHQRRHGDVEDIGFRTIAEGQEKDVEKGNEAIREMKQLGLLPRELDNEAIKTYVVALGHRIATNSDLRVPAHITVLDSDEINAFALPGGFLFVHRGLIEAVEDEAQLAGVLAHETAHAAARHGNKLMKKATIASIIYQVAQIAAMVVTGGVVGIGTYYALQYGFYGLGLILSLDLLGVSREFELEADQLGVQYAWKAGYDPTGFIRFSDKMASTEGYVRGASWFRTHPSFYERMVQAQREIRFLPAREALVVETTEFGKMKYDLAGCKDQAAEDQPCKPSLLEPYEKDCPPPDKIEYDRNKPIEALCFPDEWERQPTSSGR
jgi:hypothetical protein